MYAMPSMKEQFGAFSKSQAILFIFIFVILRHMIHVNANSWCESSERLYWVVYFEAVNSTLMMPQLYR